MRALRPYLLGGLLVVFFTAAKALVPALGRDVPFLFYFAPPLAAALLGGRRAGLFTAAVAAAMGNILFLPPGTPGPAGPFRTSPWAVVQTGAFLIEAVVVVLVCDALLQARMRLLERSRAELTLAVRERRRLLDLFRQVPASIQMLRGPDLIVELAHPKAVEAVGHRDIEGKPLLVALPEFADQPHVARMRRVLETGEPSEMREVSVLLDNRGTGVRTETFWHSTYQAIRGEGGRIEGVLAFDIEVTDEVRRRHRLELLQRVTFALSRALAVSEVASVVLDVGRPHLGAPRGGVWRVAEDGVALELVEHRGYSEALVGLVGRVPLESRLPIARVLETKAICWISSREDYARLYPGANEETYPVRTADETSFFCAPLLVDGRAVGALSLHFGVAHAYDEDEKQFIRVLVDQSALALHRAVLFALRTRRPGRGRARAATLPRHLRALARRHPARRRRSADRRREPRRLCDRRARSRRHRRAAHVGPRPGAATRRFLDDGHPERAREHPGLGRGRPRGARDRPPRRHGPARGVRRGRQRAAGPAPTLLPRHRRSATRRGLSTFPGGGGPAPRELARLRRDALVRHTPRRPDDGRLGRDRHRRSGHGGFAEDRRRPRRSGEGGALSRAPRAPSPFARRRIAARAGDT